MVAFLGAHLHAETSLWARAFGADLLELSSSSTAYWEALSEAWCLPGDLVNIEQDVVPAQGVVTEMLACSQDWCSSPYRIATVPQETHPLWATEDGVTCVRAASGSFRELWLTDGLGCVKFSDSLKRALPHALAHAGEPDGDGYPSGWWRLLDVRLSRFLRSRGFTPHLHRRSRHLRNYDALRRAYGVRVSRRI